MNFHTDTRPLTVLLRVDATAEIGVGHAMRLLALAQELAARGCAVELAGDITVPWVIEAYERLGIRVHPVPATPTDMCRFVEEVKAGVVIIDGYDISPAVGTALRGRGIPVMAMVDGEFGAAQDADLYVDQNPGAEPRTCDGSARALAGAQFTMFRDDVLALRQDAHELPEAPAHSVFAVFGGTDPMGAVHDVIPMILATGYPVHIRVVSTRVTAKDFAPRPHQSVEVIPPTSTWLEQARECDLVVTASGSSVWELLCLGTPTAVVCVADNQRPGYDLVVLQDLAAPAGELARLRDDAAALDHATAAIQQTLQDGLLRKKRALHGQALLDGRGRERVADAIFGLILTPRQDASLN